MRGGQDRAGEGRTGEGRGGQDRWGGTVEPGEKEESDRILCHLRVAQKSTAR